MLGDITNRHENSPMATQERIQTMKENIKNAKEIKLDEVRETSKNRFGLGAKLSILM